MFPIPLNQLPNQAISFNVDGAYWQLRIYQAVDMMYVDISLNGAVLINGVRCFSGIPVIPYEYLHLPKYGNFVFDNPVDWNNFETGCFLYYLKVSEYLEYRALGVLH